MPNTCGSCKYWRKFTNYDFAVNTGNCDQISEKVTVDVKYGWEGGYVRAFETEEDFGCTLHEDTEM